MADEKIWADSLGMDELSEPERMKVEQCSATTDYKSRPKDKRGKVLLRNMSSQYEKIKRIDKKHFYYVIVGILLIAFIAVGWGMLKDSSKAKDRKENNDTVKYSQAVKGDHLLNVPKDYTAKAEADAKAKAEADKHKTDSKTNSPIKPKPDEKASPMEQKPVLPQQPSIRTNNRLSAMEKALLAKEDRRQKALSSPIGFDLKK